MLPRGMARNEAAMSELFFYCTLVDVSLRMSLSDSGSSSAFCALAADVAAAAVRTGAMTL